MKRHFFEEAERLFLEGVNVEVFHGQNEVAERINKSNLGGLVEQQLGFQSRPSWLDTTLHDWSLAQVKLFHLVYTRVIMWYGY
jgi:hypothetical protein